MKEEIGLIRFYIKIFNQFGALVEEFGLSAETKQDVEKMVRDRMRTNNMDARCTFKIS